MQVVRARKVGIVSKPNIVVVMTDQQRADFTRAAGFPLWVVVLAAATLMAFGLALRRAGRAIV